MELRDAVARRRMVRSFEDRPLPPGLGDTLARAALRAPTAGNAGGTAWVLLEGPEETARYWDATTTQEWRARSPRWPGLSRAPGIAVALSCPGAYLARYDEPDKAGSGLGVAGGTAAWPVPYWHGDAAFGVMTMLLSASDEGVGACFLGIFRGEDALLASLGVPDGWRVFGAVVLGYPDGRDHPSASLARPVPPVARRLHHGRWDPGPPGAAAQPGAGGPTARQ